MVKTQAGSCLRSLKIRDAASLLRTGHGDSRWLTAVIEQAKVLTHTSNLFHTVPQVLVSPAAVIVPPHLHVVDLLLSYSRPEQAIEPTHSTPTAALGCATLNRLPSVSAS